MPYLTLGRGPSHQPPSLVTASHSYLAVGLLTLTLTCRAASHWLIYTGMLPLEFLARRLPIWESGGTFRPGWSLIIWQGREVPGEQSLGKAFWLISPLNSHL